MSHDASPRRQKPAGLALISVPGRDLENHTYLAPGTLTAMGRCGGTWGCPLGFPMPCRPSQLAALISATSPALHAPNHAPRGFTQRPGKRVASKKESGGTAALVIYSRLCRSSALA